MGPSILGLDRAPAFVALGPDLRRGFGHLSHNDPSPWNWTVEILPIVWFFRIATAAPKSEPPLVSICVGAIQYRLGWSPLRGVRLLRRDRFSGAQTDPTPTRRRYRFRSRTVFERPSNVPGYSKRTDELGAPKSLLPD
jgi:hypothetical protein